MNRSGILEWESGECREFIIKFFSKYGLPPPELPLVVFRTIYNEVKAQSNMNLAFMDPQSTSRLRDSEGLDWKEAVHYAKRVHAMILDFKGEMKMQAAEHRKSRLLSVTSMAQTMDGRTAKSPSISKQPWQDQKQVTYLEAAPYPRESVVRSSVMTSMTDCFPEAQPATAAMRGSQIGAGQARASQRAVSPRTRLAAQQQEQQHAVSATGQRSYTVTGQAERFTFMGE